MKKKLNINISTTYGTIVLILCLLPLKGNCQSGDTVVDKLVEMGFENVSWHEDETERVYVFENTPYRLSGVGVGKAIDQVQEYGIPDKKSCRVIVLENNIPMISLYYNPIPGDTIPAVTRQDWKVSYDLGGSWEKVRKQKKANSSLFKVDIVVYPELQMSNLILNQVYQVIFSLNPAVEVSLWQGMKFTAQLIIPVWNNDKYYVFSDNSKQVRQGYIALTQSVRLPYNTFVTANVGTFNNLRWGMDLKVKHILMKDERFSLEGRIGYTGMSRFDNFKWYVSPLKRVTWSVGGNFYWPKYNMQASLRAEQYLLSEKGIRFDVMRNFRYATIGFYAMKAQNAPKNGGFYFQIALPPYKKYKRKYVRVRPSDYFGMLYNGGNERYYGKSYTPQLGSTYAYDTKYNPYFIKSELLNY